MSHGILFSGANASMDVSTEGVQIFNTATKETITVPAEKTCINAKAARRQQLLKVNNFSHFLSVLS